MAARPRLPLARPLDEVFFPPAENGAASLRRKNSAIGKRASHPRSIAREHALERPFMPQKFLLFVTKLAGIAFCVLAFAAVLAAQAATTGPLGIGAAPLGIPEGQLGIFDGQQDVGTVLHP